jgi:hypothetical protein
MFETPELNDSLYLHSLSISEIPTLIEFQHVLFLSLDQNQLTDLDWLPQFKNLRFLYLDNNLLEALHLSGDSVPDSLEQLHVANNAICSVEIVEDCACRNLKLVKLRQNKLIHFPRGVEYLLNLEILDISENYIEEPVQVISDFLKSLPTTLCQLYLSPNPFIANVRRYRQFILQHVPCNLTFLDSKFVSPVESEIAKSAPDKAEEIRKKHETLKRQELNDRIEGLKKFQSECVSAKVDRVALCREIISLAANN